jgi:hypothetical protein
LVAAEIHHILRLPPHSPDAARRRNGARLCCSIMTSPCMTPCVLAELLRGHCGRSQCAQHLLGEMCRTACAPTCVMGDSEVDFHRWPHTVDVSPTSWTKGAASFRNQDWHDVHRTV